MNELVKNIRELCEFYESGCMQGTQFVVEVFGLLTRHINKS